MKIFLRYCIPPGQKCLDPCPGSCGVLARCSVQNHNPICSCPAGYTGDPFTRCVEQPKVTPKPPPRDPCNPSPCGTNAACQVRSDKAVCTCVRDYTGDPTVGCRPECLLNSDCPADKACVGSKCRDPCPGTCGINAACRVANHNAVCVCNEGYTGDPFSQCALIRKFRFFISLHYRFFISRYRPGLWIRIPFPQIRIQLLLKCGSGSSLKICKKNLMKSFLKL